MYPHFPRFLIALLACVICAWASTQLRAQDVNITTHINPPEAQVGQPVEYTVNFTGSVLLRQNPLNPQPPPGVELNYRGARSNTQFSLGSSSSRQSRVIFSYIARASKAGKYTIPEQEVMIDRRRYTVPAATFTVVDSPLTTPNAQAGSATNAGKKPKVWSKLRLARSVAYVGEMVPAELIVYFDQDVQPLQQPNQLDVNIEGFTVQDWQSTRPQSEVVDGRHVLRFAFHTAISPAKPGKFTLPPVSSVWKVRMEDGRSGRINPNDPFGSLFNMDPDAFHSLMGIRDIPISSEPIEIEVRDLPEEGKPANFSGAVGKFGLLANVTPAEAKVGEPLTLKMKISGQGNFGRVSTPVVQEDPTTWKLYPPKAEFVQMDALGIEGAKNFEQLIIPQRATTFPPAIEFSYFDPYEETYVTLKPEELPLAVVGAPIAPTPAPGTATVAADDEQEPGSTDVGLVPLITKMPPRAALLPIYQRSVFWAAQGVPLAILLGLLILNVRGYRREHPSAKKQLTGLRAELSQAQASMSTTGASAMDVYLSARRVLQLELELRAGKHIADTQLQEALNSHAGIQGTDAEDVDSFFERFSEIVYSGQGEAQLNPDEQKQIAEFTHRIAKHLG